MGDGGLPSGWVAMVNNAFSGTNFTFKMKIRPGATISDLGLVGRYVDLNNYYYLRIIDGNRIITQIAP